MKTCEICDRPIKTGRKYCWEHRHTTQAEALRGDKIINQATKGYYNYRTKIYNYKTKRNDKTLYTIIIILETIWLIIVFRVFGMNSKLFPYLFFIGSFCVTFLSFFIAWKYFGVEFQYYKKIKEDIGDPKEDIENRDPKYVRWVKEWVQDEKEEKEFRKSLLK